MEEEFTAAVKKSLLRKEQMQLREFYIIPANVIDWTGMK